MQRGIWGADEEKHGGGGVRHVSAINALLFIIYLDDVMGEYAFLNTKPQIPLKHTAERPRSAVTPNITNHIQRNIILTNAKNKRQIIEK